MTDKTAAAGWQPIGTAPENGLPQVVNDPAWPGTWEAAYWSHFGWVKCHSDARMNPQPTHWLPVPPMPEVTL